MNNRPEGAPTPERIMQFATGHWAASLQDAAVHHRVFSHLSRGAQTVAELAGAATIAPRGAQALLDGLVGLGLVTVKDGRYANAPDAEAFLVEGKPPFLGGFVTAHGSSAFDGWARLAEVVRTGAPDDPQTDIAENAFWEDLVRSLIPLGIPVAEAAAEHLKLATQKAPSLLDIGGGAGIYASVWLRQNPTATATQLDWANVNGIARAILEDAGLAERFTTRDGDFHSTDFGSAEFDAVVLSNIAHQETPADNLALFKRCRQALKPQGTLIVSDFVIDDDRSGPPFPLLFTCNMLLHTPGGASYCEADYRAWLSEAGFGAVTIKRLDSPSTLIFATP